MPKKLSKMGMPFLKKLVAYRSEDAQNAENKVIYFIKRNKNDRVALFLASQLSDKVNEILNEIDIEAKDAVLVYIPRSERAVAENGFDQSALICSKLAELSKVELLPIIVRRRKRAKEQKMLSAAQRASNVTNLFAVDKDIKASKRLNGKTVILFDDVVTSGASMAEAYKILSNSGAENIYGLCIALTQTKKLDRS